MNNSKVLLTLWLAAGFSARAAGGAFIGAPRSGLDADRDKQRVFKRCLRGRGYRVLN